jgi:OPA family glycerol-3-phosphate transporter-like MFS transporter
MLFCALSREDYSRGCVRVSWGSSLGTMTVYLMAPLLILLLNWKSVFLASAIFGIAGLLIWLKSAPTIDLAPPKEKNSSGSFRPAVLPALILVMVGIILHGILKDGVTTWMPSYLSETFGLRNEISILAGIVLPVFSIICYSLVNFLYLKMKKVLLGTILIFCMASAFCGALYLFYDKSPVLSILLSALITSCMHGVNLFLVCVVPAKFEKYGIVSTMSGLINSLTYVGSALATQGFALTKQYSGWTVTIGSWLVIAAIGIACCLLAYKPWKKFKEA